MPLPRTICWENTLLSCFFYAWPTHCPRKTMKISSVFLCLHPSCVWVCSSYINGSVGEGHRGTQDKRAGLTWPQSKNSMNHIHKSSPVISEIFIPLFLSSHMLLHYGQGVRFFECLPPGLPITKSLGTIKREQNSLPQLSSRGSLSSSPNMSLLKCSFQSWRTVRQQVH